MALQKPYRGLSNLLGFLNQGALNLELFPGVIPTVDIARFAEEPRFFGQQGLNVTAPGQNLALADVPQDEIWIVSAIGIQQTAGVAAQTMEFELYISETNNNALSPLIPLTVPSDMFSTGDLAFLGKHFPSGLRLDPGNRIGFRVTQYTGPLAMPVEMGLQYQRLTV